MENSRAIGERRVRMTLEPRRDLLSADRRARQAAQTQFDRHLVLEAGAGTGKTTTLVARTLMWCLGPGWELASQEVAETAERRFATAEEPTADRVARTTLEGILAITFTENAANEMASRVTAALADLGSGNAHPFPGLDLSLLSKLHHEPLQDQVLFERARALLGNLDRLSVRTFHSFCRSLLAKYPLEAGLHPDLKIDADESILDDIVHQTVDRNLRASYTTRAPTPLTKLILLGVDPSEVVANLKTLVSQGATSDLLANNPFSSDELGQFRARLLHLLEAFHQQIPPGFASIKRTRIPREVTDAVERSLEITAAGVISDLPAMTEFTDQLKAAWKSSLVSRLAKWAKGDYLQSELQALEDCDHHKDLKQPAVVATFSALAEKLSRLLGHIEKINPDLLEVGRQALFPLLEEIEREMRTTGVATFQSLVLEASELLYRHPEIAARERRTIRQLLVDESQDSDGLQCGMIRTLVLQGPSEQCPTLFMVGDPKQSIYGWRNADLEAYLELVSEIVAAGGMRYALVENFRSAPPILNEIERTIAPIMTPQERVQPPFEPLLPSKALRGDSGYLAMDWVPVEFWVSSDTPSDTTSKVHGKMSVGRAAALEAAAIAADLVKLKLETSLAWKDIGILMRSAIHVEIYLEALRKAGIPFSVSRDKQFYRRREVIDAAALVRCVMNPVDHVALLTFLRSAVVGVPDAALIPLWAHGFPQLITDLQSPQDQALEDLGNLIREVAAELPDGVPGLDRIPGWKATLTSAVINLAVARRNYEKLPPDLFIEDLRRRFLLEVTESMRYQGSFRVANLDRFFRLLEQDLENAAGDTLLVQQSIQRRIASAKEAAQARPLGSPVDAVQVTTIHQAKGLEFAHVYLVEMHTREGPSRRSSCSVDERYLASRTGAGEYTLFGAPTLQFDLIESRRRQTAQAERVRTLYVAMTRARQRLVLLGCWPKVSTPVAVSAAGSFADLLTNRLDMAESPLELRRLKKSPCDAYGARWRFLEHRPGFSPKIPRTSTDRPADLEVIRMNSERLRSHQSAAVQRMLHPVRRKASEFIPSSPPKFIPEVPTAPALTRRIGDLPPIAAHQARLTATIVGDAFHYLFATWNYSADLSLELERQRLSVQNYVQSRLRPPENLHAAARYELLFDRLERGQIFRSFVDLEERVVAREMPVLLGASQDAGHAREIITGKVDLLYRGEGADRLVIVDFKTDLVESEAQLHERADAYSGQLQVYARALSGALELEKPPELELWFIWPDRVWPVPLD